MKNYKVFREKYLLFMPPIILIFICLFALFFWNFSLKDKFSMSTIKLKSIEKKLEEEKQLNISMKKELEKWEEAINSIEKFNNKLGSSKENLTKVIKEIEEFSLKSGVVPHSYGFNMGEKEKKYFISFIINFPFEADYSSVRNFLHLLELTPTFITLNSISLGTTGEMSEKVRLQFQLVTYFKAGDE